MSLSNNIREFNYLNFNEEKNSQDKGLYKFREEKKEEFKFQFDFFNTNKNFTPMFVAGKKISIDDYEEKLKKYFENKKNKLDEELAKYKEDKKNEANEILKKAEEKVQKLIEEKSKQGYEEGFQKGYQEGLQKGYEEEKKNFNELKALIETLKKFKEELWGKYNEEIKNIILEISKKIIKKEVEIKPNEILLNNINYILEKVVDKEFLNIYISPAQYEFIEKNIDNLKDIFNISNIKIIKSDKVEKGSCVIESNFGTYDTSIKEQIKEFEELLNS